MLVIGAGTGAHKTVAIRLLSRVYPVRTGRALGAHDTVGALGGWVRPRRAVTLFVAAPPALAGFLSRLPGADWRGLFVVTGVIALALAGAFALRVPGRLPADADRGPEREGSEPGASDYLALFEDRRLAAFVIVTIASRRSRTTGPPPSSRCISRKRPGCRPRPQICCTPRCSRSPSSNSSPATSPTDSAASP